MDDAREAYWHEGEPRIIASGRWEQDELGDISYIPDHVRPSTAEAADADGPPVGGDAGPEAPSGVMGDLMDDPTGDTGYRVRSELTWAAARRDYLAGDAAEAVCARYDLKLGTLRSRAAREGWRRSDVEDVWPDPQDEAPDAAAPEPRPATRPRRRGRLLAAHLARADRPCPAGRRCPSLWASPRTRSRRHAGRRSESRRRGRPRRRPPVPRRPRRPPRHRGPHGRPQGPPRSRGADFRRFRRIRLCFSR